VRIEPAEVEAALTAIPGIGAAVVGTVSTGRTRPQAEPRRCIRCGLGDDHPGVSIDADGVCSVCRRFEGYRDRAGVYFETPEALVSLVRDAAARRTGRFDVIMLLSGGKDSSYALYRLAEITPRILALTLDNGYISDGAKANIRRVTADLGVEHRFIGTPAMDAVFLDSLKRHSNVCNGCFKVLYTLSMEIAVAEGVPAIVTGLSRGQFFETRLTPDLFEGEGTPAAEIDRLVQEARRAYHRVPDATTLLVDAPAVASGEALDRVTFIDIYRYLDVPLSEVYRLLAERAAWLRPDDTGRSTNCLINDVGIFVHKRREGFHNYALPYSWDVRMGHKTRDAALDELDDAIDPRKVQAILDRLGWDEPLDRPSQTPKLVAWFTADGPVDVAALRRALAQQLPAAMVPAHLVQVEAIPLTANGKADIAALPAPRTDRPPVETAFDAPSTATERAIAAVWSDVLGVARIGALDNFYDLGGDSIAAIRIAADARRRGLSMVATDLFEHQTVRALAARVVTDAPPAQPRVRRKARVTLGETDLATLGRALGPSSGGGG
jgi:hypothetical protein